MTIEVLVAIIVILLLVVALLIIAIQRNKRDPSNKKQELMLNAFPEHNISVNDAISISEIETLILTSSNGQELSLKRPDMLQNAEKKYREITIRVSSAVGQVVQGTMPILAKAQTLSQIAKAAPNGLFTTTGTVQDLMRYGDGTVASFVRKGGKFGTHSGFAEVAIVLQIQPLLSAAQCRRWRWFQDNTT